MNISAKINDSIYKKIIKKYSSYKLDSPNVYVIFFAKVKDATLTMFTKKKDEYSLTYTNETKTKLNQFIKAYKINEYEFYDNDNTESVKEVESDTGFKYIDDQIGSDEVGTGDFFGPICVVAALVKKTDLKRLKELGVMDSKKLDDEKIRKIAKVAIKEFKYSSLTLDNAKYNQLTAKGFNMNKLKCYLHNKALSNLSKKNPKIKNIYIDQFVYEKKYYEHLKDEKDVLKGIVFHTKGESYFPSVALASVIARYSFLLKMDELNKKYKTNIPFGASNIVDKFASNFVKKYGIKELDKIVKKNFVNYDKLTK